MATQPDPRDYVTRDSTSLMSLGSVLRFGGINISWLTLRDDNGRPDGIRVPTDFEVRDALNTVLDMGVGTVRVLSLGASAGCAQCLLPAPGPLNPDALKQADHVLRLAHDAGLKVIIPLAGPGTACPAQGPADPVYDTPCTFAAWRGKPVGAFYTDPQVRGDFVQFVTALLHHVNVETGIAYMDDPTILAWENCDGCGAGQDTHTIAGWTEFLGQTIKGMDTHHLYENGAFAGRIASGAGAPAREDLALPSVDMIGDRLPPRPGTAPADLFTDALQAVTKAGRIYVIDSYGWTPAFFPAIDDLQAFHAAFIHDRTDTGAFVTDLQGHADQGGYLPPTRPGFPALYFPGAPSGQMDSDTVQARARAVRRFSYRMMDFTPPAFSQTGAAEILSAVHGKLRWRGTAGALKYSIERTNDVTMDGSWVNVCDQCASDTSPEWQDPSVPAGPVWYRIIAFNANMHIGLASAPVQDK